MTRPLTQKFSSLARLACMLLALWGGAALQARTAAAPAQDVAAFVVRGERLDRASPAALARGWTAAAAPAAPEPLNDEAPAPSAGARKLYLLHCTLLC